jgi:hypothetical protein
LEKLWRDSKIGAIYEGTSNIQLETIAKLIRESMPLAHSETPLMLQARTSSNESFRPSSPPSPP